MELTLVNQELCESKLYRNHSMGKRLLSKNVSVLLYLNTLALVLLYKDRDHQSFAKKYARSSTRWPTYSLFRTSATDLYALAHHVSYPDSLTLSLKDGDTGVKYLESLNFDHRRHWRFVNGIASGRMEDSHTYLSRLSVQLRIQDGRYQAWRRQVAGYVDFNDKQKRKLASDLSTEINRIARPQELIPRLNNVKTSSTLQKVATTTAGALIGRQVAKKMDTNKTVGTGLGAIAGYWAGK